ncbi:hypothetical protein [Flavobacterium capsici]|uniref:Outer membrane lipoprotein-sorting protein n=1 Tax=Flavobacterium capsici TaxID=3075618 RepID=A0AA96EYP6_9FLAO|nr:MULTISPECIES: hypothetical protein [unclassified Flavobacterium]WNM19472.1 hypothetical protein RN608_02035 [Flavobacterium sp. PMR2A8]WNM20861.1 hypothetical protein RN605_09205 [Flavobacterium sp. PMTSA4]
MRYLLFFILFSFQISFSQAEKMLRVEEVFSLAEKAVTEDKYVSYETSYKLYLDYEAKEIFEEYKGVFVKKNNINYLKIKNTEFVTFTKYALKINHDEKAISINSHQETNTQQNPFSISDYLKSFPEKKIKIEGNNYVCELKPSKISQIMFSKIIVYINKTDYSVVKQKFYYVEKMESNDKNGKLRYSTPRLEITFTRRPKNPELDTKLLKQENYFTEAKGNIMLSKKLSKYKLFKT